jgi:hypothetical protein
LSLILTKLLIYTNPRPKHLALPHAHYGSQPHV